MITFVPPITRRRHPFDDRGPSTPDGPERQPPHDVASAHHHGTVCAQEGLRIESERSGQGWRQRSDWPSSQAAEFRIVHSCAGGFGGAVEGAPAVPLQDQEPGPTRQDRACPRCCGLVPSN
jgi:hypothetical protein